MSLTKAEATLLRQEQYFISILATGWPHFRVLLDPLYSVPGDFGLQLDKELHAKYASVLELWGQGERWGSKACKLILKDKAAEAQAEFRRSADSFRDAQQGLADVAKMLDPSTDRPLVPAFTGLLLVHRFLLLMPSQFRDTGCAFCGLCLRCISDQDPLLTIAASHLFPASVQKHFIPVWKLPDDRKRQREAGYMDLLYIPPTGALPLLLPVMLTSNNTGDILWVKGC